MQKILRNYEQYFITRESDFRKIFARLALTELKLAQELNSALIKVSFVKSEVITERE